MLSLRATTSADLLPPTLAEQPEHFFSSEGDEEPKKRHFAILDALGAIFKSGTIEIAAKQKCVGPYADVSGTGQFKSSEVFMGRIIGVTSKGHAGHPSERARFSSQIMKEWLKFSLPC